MENELRWRWPVWPAEDDDPQMAQMAQMKRETCGRWAWCGWETVPQRRRPRHKVHVLPVIPALRNVVRQPGYDNTRMSWHGSSLGRAAKEANK